MLKEEKEGMDVGTELGGLLGGSCVEVVVVVVVELFVVCC